MINFRTQLVVAAQYKIGYDKIKSGYYGILRMANGSIAYHSNIADKTLDAAKARVSKLLKASDNKVEVQTLQTYVNNHLGLDLSLPANDDSKIVRTVATPVKPADSVGNPNGNAYAEWLNWVEQFKKTA